MYTDCIELFGDKGEGAELQKCKFFLRGSAIHTCTHEEHVDNWIKNKKAVITCRDCSKYISEE